MRSLLWLLTSSALTLSLAACSGADVDEAESGGNAVSSGAVCTLPAAPLNEPLADVVRKAGGEVDSNGVVIHNYTAWPLYDTSWYEGSGPAALKRAFDPDVLKPRTDAKDARANIASRFGDCASNVETHLANKKPNVYIYFTGFGGETQNNSLVDEPGILHWINKRDPNALIFSMNWSCSNSRDKFCEENALRLRSSDQSPERAYMKKVIGQIAPDALDTVDQILAATEGNQTSYNLALSHSMKLAAQLIDQLLVADADGGGVGNIHVLGYSMGAHAASQVLVQDFTGEGKGYNWTRKGQCDDGGDSCTIAHLKKMKWGLSLGLSGWSEAVLAYNQSGRDAADINQYRNGGLYRIDDKRFNGKANVFNRRMDPTGNSDDTLERGFGDIFYSDYNHYSHDYSMPLFVNSNFVNTLDAFLENPGVTNSTEFGIVYDNAGKVDFDDCTPGEPCEASAGYLAHKQNRSHEGIRLAHTNQVSVTDGVKHPDKSRNLAVSFASGASKPIVLNTFDQEDLRGGVELYFRPKFDTKSKGVHGLFSYGGCEGSKDELMPQAFIEDGNVVFLMSYQGKEYKVSVPVSQASLKNDEWTHLAFTWDLPIVSIAKLGPDLGKDAQTYGQALVLAAGLREPLPTTYNKQQGIGELRIYANGELVAKDALGTTASARECLSASEVLGTHSYSVDGEQFPAFTPYANYSATGGDSAQSLGTTCKAFRVRNEQAFFGCAKSESANAGGDMDDITLVWGPGRVKYDEIDHRTGAPALWPIGVSYSSKPYQAE